MYKILDRYEPVNTSGNKPCFTENLKTNMNFYKCYLCPSTYDETLISPPNISREGNARHNEYFYCSKVL